MSEDINYSDHETQNRQRDDFDRGRRGNQEERSDREKSREKSRGKSPSPDRSNDSKGSNEDSNDDKTNKNNEQKSDNYPEKPSDSEVQEERPNIDNKGSNDGDEQNGQNDEIDKPSQENDDSDRRSDRDDRSDRGDRSDDDRHSNFSGEEEEDRQSYLSGEEEEEGRHSDRRSDFSDHDDRHSDFDDHGELPTPDDHHGPDGLGSSDTPSYQSGFMERVSHKGSALEENKAIFEIFFGSALILFAVVFGAIYLIKRRHQKLGRSQSPPLKSTNFAMSNHNIATSNFLQYSQKEPQGIEFVAQSIPYFEPGSKKLNEKLQIQNLRKMTTQDEILDLS